MGLLVKYWLIKMIKKIVFACLIVVAFVSTSNALYVRKLKEPEFFIPETDKMHKIEKLPVVEGLENNKKEVKKDISFSKIPPYKNKFDLYQKKLDEFVKTGVFPKDENLEKDMADMSEEKVFEVVEQPMKTFETKEQYKFFVLAKKIAEN